MNKQHFHIFIPYLPHNKPLKNVGECTQRYLDHCYPWPLRQTVGECTQKILRSLRPMAAAANPCKMLVSVQKDI